jgi:hypothetical protein
MEGKISWLTDALAPAVVALVQLAVVTLGLEVARRAKLRAAAAEAELESLREQSKRSAS